ncbi:DUF1707 SHOCT-like domain-containing protein [Aeromicrobium sp. CF3.5]|uniref:DUF1707 SHOCT-like domain-containing protein n=1 Tax=Aeromicrobium sp. CF3.5 TaxID=3373078 RepID=UPI003EE77238
MSAGAAWERFSADPRAVATTAMRASDADRDLALEVLREAFADGRLSRDEYDERTDAALAIRVLGDVVPVLGDLVPVGRAPQRRPRDDLHDQAVSTYRRDLRDARTGWIFVSATTVAVWGATSIAGGGPYFFWPIFPMIGVGIGWFSMRMNAESRIEDHEEKLVQKAQERKRLEE